MENIKDWCISRQIWWGHRLPVYYCKDCMRDKDILLRQGFGEQARTQRHKDTKTQRHKDTRMQGFIVSKVKPDKCPVCSGADLSQDEDVLDTWFSSWLWPFSTLGWPEKTKDMGYFYPTSILITAPEILFFWVARMIMSSEEFIKEIPFSDVYIHGTVRDVTGKKMSKSLGNIIDPLEVIDRFGADALRFSVISITATGQDVFLSKEKFEIGRNFANKIWNASRFVLMNIKTKSEENLDRCQTLSIADKWIMSRLNRAIEAVTKALKNYRFNEAESLVYDFFWHDFCDWYVEMVKPEIAGQVTGHRSQVTGKILIHVLENSLKLLHPFMPFVTEAIWQTIKERESIMTAAWPETDKHYIDKKIESDMELVKNIIVNVRNIRSDMNIPYSKKLIVDLVPLKKGSGSILSNNAEYIKNLAHLEKLTIDENFIRPKSCLSAVTEEFNIFIPLEGVIDVAAEKSRLVKKQDLLKQQIVFTEKKLKDKNFMDHAPENVVAAEQERAGKFKEQIKRLEETIKAL
jgi:valyl-tRNA synthetase